MALIVTLASTVGVVVTENSNDYYNIHLSVQWRWCEMGLRGHPILAAPERLCLSIENYCLVSWRAIAMENY